MRIRRYFVHAALIASVAVPVAAQVATASRTRTHVQTLASEKFGGREAGSEGERLAADYIVSQLMRIGARPLPGRQDLYQPFEFTAGSRDGGSTITISRETTDNGVGRGVVARSDAQIRALAFSDDGTVTGDVVFAGYGVT